MITTLIREVIKKHGAITISIDSQDRISIKSENFTGHATFTLFNSLIRMLAEDKK